MLQACARNFAELAALRALSGAVEACADPAFMLITSMWSPDDNNPSRLVSGTQQMGLALPSVASSATVSAISGARFLVGSTSS